MQIFPDECSWLISEDNLHSSRRQALRLKRGSVPAIPTTSKQRSSTVDRISKLLARQETSFVVFALFAGLFLWPMATFENLKNPLGIWGYYYTVWAALIALLFFMSRSLAKHSDGEGK